MSFNPIIVSNMQIPMSRLNQTPGRTETVLTFVAPPVLEVDGRAIAGELGPLDRLMPGIEVALTILEG